MVVLDAERTRRIQVPRVRDILLLPCRKGRDFRLERALLDSGRGQGPVQVLAHAVGARSDRADVVEVASVAVVLAARGAAAGEDDEEHRGEDQEGDQPGQAQHRDEAGRGADRPPRAAGRGSARRPRAFGGLFRLRLVEEVELDVAIALSHGLRGRGASPSRSGIHSNPYPPRSPWVKDLPAPPPTLESRCRTQPQPLSRASSYSAATGRCDRSGAADQDRSGWPGTSRTASTSR